jgi:hypothetical protein
MGVAGRGYAVSGKEGGKVHRRTVTTMIPGRRLQALSRVADQNKRLDYGAGLEGPLVAYRWNGDARLQQGSFATA